MWCCHACRMRLFGKLHSVSVPGARPEEAKLQVEVLVDGCNEDGEWTGRTQWDAPDVDPIVFLTTGEGQAPLEAGQMRQCRVVGASLFDLEAVTIS